MKKQSDNELKDRIEKVLKGENIDFSEMEITKLVETVNVYHVELEYQNEELRRIQADLENTKARFISLFQNAPVGYVLCDNDLLIQSANNTFCRLVQRDIISDSEKITEFIHPDSQDIFYLYFRRLQNLAIPDSIEIKIKSGARDVSVNVEGNVYEENGENYFRLAIIDLTVQKQREEVLKEKTWELGERVKELNCLFGVSTILEKSELSNDELMNALLDLIPPSWQFPELTCVRIIMGKKEYKSPNFMETSWKIAAPIIVDKKSLGTIEVYYLEEVPEINGNVFLKEEYDLLLAIAGSISRHLDRREIQEILQKSEENLRITLNSIGDAVISTDLKGRVTNLNPIAEELTGWTCEEARKQPLDKVFNIINAITGKKAENPAEVVLEKGIIVGLANHTKLIAKDGREYQIADSAAPIKDDKGEISGVVMVFRDVTESYRIREELDESDRHLRKAQSMSKTGSWQFMLKTGVVKASEEAYRIYGLPVEKEFNISDIQKIPLPEYRPILDDAMRKLISGEAKYEVEFEILRPDGKIFDIYSVAEYNSTEQTVTGFIQDITDRKNAERALAENEHYYRSLIYSLHEDIVVIDKDYRITDINNSALRTVGMSREEAIGKYCYEVTHRCDTPCHMNGEKCGLRQVFETGESINLHHEHITESGESIFLDLLCSPLIDKDGNITHMIEAARDVTDLFEAQMAVAQSEEKFRNLFKKHSAIKLIIDSETGDIIEANDAATEFYGWTTEELEKMNISQINTLPIEEIKRKFSQIKNGERTHFEFQHRKADDSIIDVEVFASVIDFGDKKVLHYIIHDITEKRIANRQLKLLSRSVEQNPVAIVITDADGNIEYVNPAFIKTTGYTLEEVSGSNPKILQSGYQSPEFYKELWDTILSGKDWFGVMRNKKKNGEFYWESANISSILDHNGNITHFVGVKEDISERKKLMEDLVIAKEKAEESDRLKSAFLANMSHEIRTPMNGILGFTGLLRNPDLSSEKKDKFIEIIHTSGQRMLNTVNDIVEISKIEAGIITIDFEETEVNRRIEEIVSFFQPEVEEKGLTLTIDKEVSGTPHLITTDKRKLDAIFINLIKNAIKYTEKGSIVVGCNQNDDFIEFYVKDTGIGIPIHRQEAVFNRFEQADSSRTRSFEGSGLGLAIAKSYIELFGGEIWMESEENVGTTFYFTHPLNITK